MVEVVRPKISMNLVAILAYGSPRQKIAQYITNAWEAYAGQSAEVSVTLQRIRNKPSLVIEDWSPSPITREGVETPPGQSQKQAFLGRYAMGRYNAITGQDPLCENVWYRSTALGDVAALLNVDWNAVEEDRITISYAPISTKPRCSTECVLLGLKEQFSYADLRRYFAEYYAPIIRAGKMKLSFGGEPVLVEDFPPEIKQYRTKHFRAHLWPSETSEIRWYWLGTLVFKSKLATYNVAGEVIIDSKYKLEVDPAKEALHNEQRRFQPWLRDLVKQHFKPAYVMPDDLTRSAKLIVNRIFKQMFPGIFPGRRMEIDEPHEPRPTRRSPYRHTGTHKPTHTDPPKTPSWAMIDLGITKPVFVRDDSKVRINTTSLSMTRAKANPVFAKSCRQALWPYIASLCGWSIRLGHKADQYNDYAGRAERELATLISGGAAEESR